MALIEHGLFGVEDKVATAIGRLKYYEPREGFWVAVSGGKDSSAVLKLCKMAGVKFDAHHQIAMEPPEARAFLRKHHPEVKIHQPKKTMWELIAENGIPPMKRGRYCCRLLKEGWGEGRVCVTGVRRDEGTGRSGREVFAEDEKLPGKFHLCPIVDWSESDVWEFIEKYDVPYCGLYDIPGHDRIGCVMCPNGNTRQMKFHAETWPNIAKAYIKTFDKCVAKRKADGKKCTWENGREMFDWWVAHADKKNPDQPEML